MSSYVVHRSRQWATLDCMSTQPHMRVAEFAARMAMTDRTVRARIATGEIHAVNIGTDAKPVYRISEAELARWVAERAA